MFDSDFVEEYEEGHDTFVQTGGVLVLEEVSLEGCKEERAKQGEATRGEEKEIRREAAPTGVVTFASERDGCGAETSTLSSSSRDWGK